MSESRSLRARRDRPWGLEGWAPFRDLDFPSRIGRMMEDAFGDRAISQAGVLVPPVDIAENDTHYLVSAEIAGVKKEDLKVELEENVLTIAGEKKSSREEEKDKGRWLERSYGAFSRSFSLPADADPARIEASFRDGVLHVNIAKRPEAKPKAIAVK